MAEFFAMGGYAAFVWIAWGLTTVVLVLNVIAARRRMRNVLNGLALHAARRSKGG